LYVGRFLASAWDLLSSETILAFNFRPYCFRGDDLRRLLIIMALLLAGFLTGVLSGCGWQRRKTDEELGLNPQQARGRRVFDQYCDRCHDAYGSWSWNGPSLAGVMKKKYLPSGTPANEERVREVIRLGKSKMPSFGKDLTPEQLDALMSYLHTL
jgi:mono/diheme cytochrome c family protein